MLSIVTTGWSVAVGLLSCVATGACARGQTSEENGALARRLLADSSAEWRTVLVPGARLRFARGGAADRDAPAVAELVRVIRRDLLARLGIAVGEDTAHRANLFFVNSRDEMRRLSGRPLAGFVQQGEQTGVFVVSDGFRYGPLLRHELAHLYTFEAWGTPRAGRWLVEGLATWMAGPCQGHSPDELAAGAAARQSLVSLTELASNFARVDEVVAMPEAGSIAGFLVRREGLDAIRRRWREAPDTIHPLGRNGPTIEAAWLSELRSARPAALDVARLMVEGC